MCKVKLFFLSIALIFVSLPNSGKTYWRHYVRSQEKGKEKVTETIWEKFRNCIPFLRPAWEPWEHVDTVPSAADIAYDFLGESAQQIELMKAQEREFMRAQEERFQPYYSWIKNHAFPLGFLFVSLSAVIASNNLPFLQEKLEVCTQKMYIHTSNILDLKHQTLCYISQRSFKEFPYFMVKVPNLFRELFRYFQ